MDRFLPYVALGFMLIAVLVDFTSKFLSIIVDAALLSVPVVIYLYLNKKKKSDEQKTNGSNSRK